MENNNNNYRKKNWNLINLLHMYKNSILYKKSLSVLSNQQKQLQLQSASTTKRKEKQKSQIVRIIQSKFMDNQYMLFLIKLSTYSKFDQDDDFNTFLSFLESEYKFSKQFSSKEIVLSLRYTKNTKITPLVRSKINDQYNKDFTISTIAKAVNELFGCTLNYKDDQSLFKDYSTFLEKRTQVILVNSKTVSTYINRSKSESE
ncbi:hypothetical protein ACTFIR_011613 [Dictyostelium discoideum]